MTTAGSGIRKISPDEFCEMYGDTSRRALYYVRNIGKEGFVLSAFSGDAPVGYLVCRAQLGVKKLFVQVANVLEEYRGRGVCSKLLGEAEVICAEMRLNAVKICVAENTSGFGFIRDFLAGNGYVIADKVRIFRCEPGGERDYRGWEVYMAERGDRLVRWLEADGFSAVTFESAGDTVMKELYESGANEFGNDLDITPFLDGEGCNLLRSVSAVALKDGRPAAYCLVTGPDTVSAVFEQISVAKAYRNTGVLLMALAESMRRFKELGYTRAVYAIYERNTIALAFARKILRKMTSNEKAQYNFEKTISYTN
ncbi:MAG: GNAT family N-acetyltransferase [Synergistaceae bacterium]|jgi:ribosomal protein S18 acetylase RimI-like enzyme|nr:GNAT family N-acetyltransferase [Synergistaceae bacterium]